MIEGQVSQNRRVQNRSHPISRGQNNADTEIKLPILSKILKYFFFLNWWNVTK